MTAPLTPEDAFVLLSPHLGVGRTGSGTWGCACGHVLASERANADARHGRHLANVVGAAVAAERERLLGKIAKIAATPGAKAWRDLRALIAAERAGGEGRG